MLNAARYALILSLSLSLLSPVAHARKDWPEDLDPNIQRRTIQYQIAKEILLNYERTNGDSPSIRVLEKALSNPPFFRPAFVRVPTGSQVLHMHGMPWTYEIAHPRKLFHYTSREKAAKILKSKDGLGEFLVAKRPYIEQMEFGDSVYDIHFVDLTGIFFVDRLLSDSERHALTASNQEVALEVDLPESSLTLRVPTKEPGVWEHLYPLPRNLKARFPAVQVFECNEWVKHSIH